MSLAISNAAVSPRCSPDRTVKTTIIWCCLRVLCVCLLQTRKGWTLSDEEDEDDDDLMFDLEDKPQQEEEEPDPLDAFMVGVTDEVCLGARPPSRPTVALWAHLHKLGPVCTWAHLVATSLVNRCALGIIGP